MRAKTAPAPRRALGCEGPHPQPDLAPAPRPSSTAGSHGRGGRPAGSGRELACGAQPGPTQPPLQARPTHRDCPWSSYVAAAEPGPGCSARCSAALAACGLGRGEACRACQGASARPIEARSKCSAVGGWRRWGWRDPGTPRLVAAARSQICCLQSAAPGWAPCRALTLATRLVPTRRSSRAASPRAWAPHEQPQRHPPPSCRSSAAARVHARPRAQAAALLGPPASLRRSRRSTGRQAMHHGRHLTLPWAAAVGRTAPPRPAR